VQDGPLAIFEALRDPDLEWVLIDSTVIRAHHHAAGTTPGGATEHMGRSRGGFGTNISTIFDGLGTPVAFRLRPGQDADVTHAAAVIGDRRPAVVIADKGYDGDALVATLEGKWIEAVIPPRGNREEPRVYNKVLYKERNKAERGFDLLKHYRRAATRYEKRSRNYIGMVLVAAIMILLRWTTI
jgi:transposase